jgi:DNA recombination protein RmuC
MLQIAIVVLLLANLGLVGYLLLRRQTVQVEQDTQGLLLLQNQLEQLTRSMDTKLSQGNEQMFQSMRAQFDQSQRLMSDITSRVSDQLLEVTKGVTETKESTKQVFTIAEQLSSLEKVLKNQKQRGNLGEASLELVLSNVLPPGQYTPQYQFRDGEAVDMVVRTTEGLIPIDAKFPLENYVRLIDEADEARKEQYRKEFRSDVKKRIDETSKYIRPEEGTMPFAFMFIPSEAIYYDLLINKIGVGEDGENLIQRAAQKYHVVIVSPTSFLAYLQTVLQGLHALKIEEGVKEIVKNVGNLGTHLKKYEEFMKKIGKHLGTTVHAYNDAYKEFGKIARQEKSHPHFDANRQEPDFRQNHRTRQWCR